MTKSDKCCVLRNTEASLGAHLALELFNAADLDPVRNPTESISDLQALSVVRCDDSDILVRCRDIQTGIIVSQGVSQAKHERTDQLGNACPSTSAIFRRIASPGGPLRC